MIFQIHRVKQKTLCVHNKNKAPTLQGYMVQNDMRQRHFQATSSEDRTKPCEYQAGCKVNMQKISQHKLMPINDTWRHLLKRALTTRASADITSTQDIIWSCRRTLLWRIHLTIYKDYISNKNKKQLCFFNVCVESKISCI